jgi:hypothetical protein
MMRAQKLTLAALATLCLLAGNLVFSSAPAGAFADHPLIGSFGPGGPGVGAFANPQSVAVDQATGDVYVYDANEQGESSEQGRIYKFNAAGEPVKFLVHPMESEDTNVIEGLGIGPRGFGGDTQIAVDGSNGPDKGDIYFANRNSFAGEVLILSSDGVKLGELMSLTSSEGLPCGVAVSPAGDVYVRSEFGRRVQRYVPLTNPVTNSNYTSKLSGLGSTCNMAADSEGSVYIATPGNGQLPRPVTKYPASQFSTEETEASGTLIPGASGATLAVDPVDNDVFVDEGSKFTQYSSSGGLLGASEAGEAIGGSFGIAVSDALGSAGDVYVSNNAGGDVDIYGSPITVPDAATGGTTNLLANGISGEATLNGTVNADGTSGASYYFQYGTDTTYGSTSPTTSFAGTQAISANTTLTELVPNTIYHYRLDATNSTSSVDYGADRQFILAATPAVNDQPPSALNPTRAGVQFAGTLDPEDSETFYHFAYVPANEYRPGTENPYAAGGATAQVSAGAGLGDQSVGPLAGSDLLPGTTYDYALVATNGAGRSIGEDHMFTTTPLTPPEATTGGVSAVSQNGATISGTVATNGLQTNYGFEIGTEAGDYGPATGLGNLGGATTQTVTMSLGELQPGTTYHYRLDANNSDGNSYGTDQTFTTPGFPTLVNVPSAPPLIATPTIAFPTGPPANTGKAQTKKLTNAQKLAAALKACAKKPKKRAGCQEQARKKYGPITKKKK